MPGPWCTSTVTAPGAHDAVRDMRPVHQHRSGRHRTIPEVIHMTAALISPFVTSRQLANRQIEDGWRLFSDHQMGHADGVVLRAAPPRSA